MISSLFEQIMYDSNNKLSDETQASFENFTEMLDAEASFDVALATAANLNLCVDRLEDMSIAVERYGVADVVAIVGVEALTVAGIDTTNDTVCLETFGEQVHIIYLKVKNFLAGLLDRLMIWLRKVMLYFNGTAGKIEKKLKSYNDGYIKFDPTTAKDPIAALSIKAFGDRIEALEILSKGPDDKALALLSLKETQTAKTVGDLGWTQESLLGIAAKLLPLLDSRSTQWKGVDELKKKQADLDKIDHDNATEPAEKIKHLKAHRTETIDTIKAINLRIKTTTLLGKQWLLICNQSDVISKMIPPSWFKNNLRIVM